MKFSRIAVFMLSALLPLVSCTTTGPAGEQRGSASYPLKIYPGETGIWAPQKDLPGKSALAPGRHHAQGPFPVEMKSVPVRKPDDKAPPGMERNPAALRRMMTSEKAVRRKAWSSCSTSPQISEEKPVLPASIMPTMRQVRMAKRKFSPRPAP